MLAWQFSKSLYTADLKSRSRFVSMQNHYNLIFREDERQLVPLCHDQDVGWIPYLNGQWPPSVTTVNGQATGFDKTARQLEMVFEAVPMFCHSGDVIQGGYIMAMLDALMAYVVIGLPEG